MGFKFPSTAWADAFKDAVIANETYRASAANWTEGAIAFVCLPAPELGLDERQGIIMDLHQGTCRDATYTTDAAAIDATPFVIEADYARWKSVISGEIEPILAMMQGRLKLARGHLPTLIRDVEGSRQLVLCASHIDTEFLD